MAARLDCRRLCGQAKVKTLVIDSGTIGGQMVLRTPSPTILECLKPADIRYHDHAVGRTLVRRLFLTNITALKSMGTRKSPLKTKAVYCQDDNFGPGGVPRLGIPSEAFEGRIPTVPHVMAIFSLAKTLWSLAVETRRLKRLSR